LWQFSWQDISKDAALNSKTALQPRAMQSTVF
jgi:hypothetical protein